MSSVATSTLLRLAPTRYLKLNLRVRLSPDRVTTLPARLKTPPQGADIEGEVTRRILSTALVSAAAFAAVLGIPATADDPTATPTASSSDPVAAVETPSPAATAAQAPTQAPTEAPTQAPAYETQTRGPDGDGDRGPHVDRDSVSLARRDDDRDARPELHGDRRADRDGHGDRRREKKRTKKRAANRSKAKNGQARACTEKDTGKASTSTSASGCVKVEEPEASHPGRECADPHKRRRQPRDLEPELLARGPGPREDRRAELLHRQVPDSPLPAPDLPGRRHAVRRPLGDPRGHQRDRDRLRPQSQRLLRRRAGLDAVHARHVEGLRRRRQPRRRQGPVQPGRRDLRRRALPEGRRRRHRHPQGRVRL